MSTFKIKIGLVAFLLVVVSTVGMLFLSVAPLGKNADETVSSSVQRAAKLVQRTQRLYAFELVARAKRLAIQKEFVTGIQEAEEKPRRVAVYDAINEADKKLAAESRKPGFLGIVDKEGKIVARDLDPNADYGEKLPFPAVAAVLKTGRAASAIWLQKNKMMRVALAPILNTTNEVVGAVVLGYGFTATEAREEHAQFGVHVAYFMGGALRASSFTVTGDPNTEDGGRVAALSKAAKGDAKKAMEANKASDVLSYELGGEKFRAVTGPLPPAVVLSGQGSKATNGKSMATKGVGFVVLASESAALAPVARTRWVMIGFGIFVLVLVLIIMWAVAAHFVNAQDTLELGVNEVINGNLEYTFDALEEFEGMANALNVMLARLLGRPEPGEDEEGDSAWRADVIFVEDLGEAGEQADLARQLAGEPEDAYFNRIYQEYVEARRAAKLPVEGITPENLGQKLKANEAMLKAKHKCQMVRFVVASAGGKVSFKPIRIG